MQCSWEMNDYLIYLSFATSAVSVVNFVQIHGFNHAIEVATGSMRFKKKIFFYALGLISGCYGFLIGLYFIYIKSINISIYILPVFIFFVARIWPLEISVHLLVKLFPKLSNFGIRLLSSFTFRFLSIISPFWFLNFLKGAEFVFKATMETHYKASIRSSHPQKTMHPSILLTIPCIYGRVPSASGCVRIDSLLDEFSWNPLLNKLYRNFYKPQPFIVQNESRFLEYALDFGGNMKGIRILIGNFNFLRLFSANENVLLIVDTLLLGAFSSSLIYNSLDNVQQRWRSLGLVMMEVLIRMVVIIVDMYIGGGITYSILGFWALLSFSTVLLMSITTILSFCQVMKSAYLTLRSLVFVFVFLMPFLVYFALEFMARKEASAWKAMIDFCADRNVTNMELKDVRNIIDDIRRMKSDIWIQGYTSISRDEALDLATKIRLEYQYVIHLTQNILYQVWFPLLLSASTLPLASFIVIIFHRLKGFQVLNLRCMVIMVAIYAMVPLVFLLGRYLKRTSLYELDIKHDFSTGYDINTFLVSSSMALDDRYCSELLKESEEWFETILTSSDGLGGECYTYERYNMPASFMFQLRSNIIHLRSKLMAKKSFILFLTPFLAYLHIFYCYS